MIRVPLEDAGALDRRTLSEVGLGLGLGIEASRVERFPFDSCEDSRMSLSTALRDNLLAGLVLVAPLVVTAFALRILFGWVSAAIDP
ncbi:hypothetical protein BRD01_08195, partial [Halobacteriales archaeon QS_8_65_32]